MIAHIFQAGGRLKWSGYNAAGDSAHEPHALIVDVGRSFQLTSDPPEGREPLLYLTGPGVLQFTTLTINEVAFAARLGYFGFRLVADAGRAAEDAPKRLGRRERIAREHAGKKTKRADSLLELEETLRYAKELSDDGCDRT